MKMQQQKVSPPKSNAGSDILISQPLSSAKNLALSAATVDTRKLSISIFADERTKRPQKQDMLTWAQVCELNRRRHFRSKKSGLMFGGYALKGDRSDANVRHRSLVQLDVDTEGEKDKSGRIVKVTRAAPELEKIRSSIDLYEWCATSSHWHEPSRGVIKYRINILPDRDIQKDEYEFILEALDERLGGATDGAAWPFSQAFYLPSCPEENKGEAFFVYNSGIPLPVDEFVRRGREIVCAQNLSQKRELINTNSDQLPETPENIGYVQSMLDAIPANIYRSSWRSVVWAVASTNWTCAEQLARDWSMTAPEKYDEADFNGVWKSYDPKREDSIGFGTLVHMARERQALGNKRSLNFNGSGADIFNGMKFAEMFREKLLHVHEINEWLLFNPERGWVTAPPGEAERAAKTVVRTLIDELLSGLESQL